MLSRFAEQFSDFVIYNWKSAMGVSDIYAAESYLSEYPDLSRNRGRCFNYQLNGLINNNVSGFEKKVKAIAGIYRAIKIISAILWWSRLMKPIFLTRCSKEKIFQRQALET